MPDAKITITASGADVAASALARVQQAMGGLSVMSESTSVRLERLKDSYSGARTVQEAVLAARAVEEIGGVGTLTAKQLQSLGSQAAEAIEKMQKTGIKEIPQNLQNIADAAKAAEVETGSLGGYFKGLAAEATSVAAGFVSASAVIGTVRSGFSAIVGEVQSSIAAYEDQEKAVALLTTALRAQGTATPVVIQQYNDLASAYQRTTVFADDQLNATEALLVQIGGVMPKDMDRALGAVTDLSAGLGIDLESATRLVAKAFEGNTSALTKYGVTVSATALEAKGASAVFDAIEQHFGGQAQSQAETYAGRLQQLANAWNNVEEAIGQFLLVNPLVEQSLRGVTEALERASDASGAGLPHLLAEIAGVLPGLDAGSVELLRTWAHLSESEDWMTAAIDTIPIIDSVTKDLIKSTLREAELWQQLDAQIGALAKRAGNPFGDIEPKALTAAQAIAGLTEAQRAQFAMLDLTTEATLSHGEAEQHAAAAAFAHGKTVSETLGILKQYGLAVDSDASALDRLSKAAQEAKTLADAARAADVYRESLRQLNQQAQTTIGTLMAVGNLTPAGGVLTLPQATMSLGPEPAAVRGVDQRAFDALNGIQAKNITNQGAFDALVPGDALIARTREHIEAATTASTKWKREIVDVAGAFASLGNIAGGTLGSIARELGQMGSFSRGISAGMKTFHDADATTADKVNAGIGIGVNALGAAQTISANAKAHYDADGNIVGGSALGGAAHGAMSGAEVGMAAGPIGAAVGAIAGALVGAISAITGPSKEELQTRTQRNDFMKDFGVDKKGEITKEGIQGVEDQLTQVGYSAQQAQQMMAKLLDAKDPQAYAEALKAIKPAIDHNTETATAVSHISALVKSFGDAGHVIPQSLRETLTSMSTLKGLTEDEKQQLAGLAAAAQPNFQSLESEAADLGISLAALGPSFEQGDLEQKTADLVGKVKDLTNAGGDLGGILAGSAAKFGDLAEESIQFGTKLPESIRPYITNLIDSNALVDSAGNKITDLTQLQFEATPLADGLDGINGSIDHLSDVLENLPALFGKVGAAITGLPAPPGDGSATSYANEGFDLAHPTRAIVGDAAGDTENVVHSGTIRQLVADSRRAGAATAGGALAGRIDALHQTMRGVREDMARAFRLQPLQLAHALRGAK